MTYIIIKWGQGTKDPTGPLIRALGFFILAERRTIYKREHLIIFRDQLNELIEKHLITDIRIDLPILKKDDDDIAWCEARVARNIDIDYVRNTT